MDEPTYQPRLTLARQIAQEFGKLPLVRAVTVAGSVTTGSADPKSDIDLYVYQTAEIPTSDRAAIASARQAALMEIDNRFWETGDEWIDGPTGTAVDIMYRSPEWVEDQLQRVLVRHEASVGYSTCFWDNILHSVALYDADGWYAALQARAQQPYPAALRKAVVAKNYPILRENISAYSHQIQKAADRGDLVSLNHRAAAFLASYFDILFAVNGVPHPGEKRLIPFTQSHCKKIPENMAAQVNGFLAAAAQPDGKILEYLNALVDGLDILLIDEGLKPKRSE